MLSKNTLVLYKNQPALIKETGDKYLIEFSGGTQKVRDKDIELLHPGPLTSLSVVLSAAETLFSSPADKSSGEAALEEAAALLEGQETGIAELAELAFGGFPAEKAWAYYRLAGETLWFACIGGTVFAPRTAEEIKAIKEKETEKNRAQETRQAFIKRLARRQLDMPDDIRFMQDIEALALGNSDKSKTLKEAGFKETQEEAHRLLLDTGIWTILKNPHPSRYGLSIQSAGEQLASPPEEERLDLTAQTAWAIDNAWSADPDDAAAFDGIYLWVHIADPASTVLPGSSIDTAARERGATLYIPEGAARMLSEKSLEDYALGLSPVSRALSFRITFDENGAVSEGAVFRTLVRVERLTYAKADELRETPELKPLFDIAARNIERRKKADAVFIELPEVHISIVQSENGAEDVHIEPSVQYASGAMVREMMLLAGEAAARFAFKNNIPFPFVSQDEPDIPKDIPEGLAGQYRLRRSMKGRRVGITPANHAGLGLGMYSQVTSPLRRYSDLAAHQQLRAFITGAVPLDRDTMLERISMGDAAAQAAVKAERASNLHWTLVYLKLHPDWQGSGTVVETKGNRATLLIPSLGQETQINMDSERQLNETVPLKAGNINIPELKVTFMQA